MIKHCVDCFERRQECEFPLLSKGKRGLICKVCLKPKTPENNKKGGEDSALKSNSVGDTLKAFKLETV